MRIVIFSDSLGRPRPDLSSSDRTQYEDIYGFLVKERLRGKHDVEICYIDSLDSQDAVHWSQRMVAFRAPDIVIFHFGVNDAAPRLFEKNSSCIMLAPIFRWLTRDFFFRILHRYRFFFTKIFPKTYTSIDQFRTNLIEIIKEVKKYSESPFFICISICFAPEVLARRSCRYNENVTKYNEVLFEIFGQGYIEINQLNNNSKFLISDNIHLSKIGHKLLAEKILKHLDKRFNK